MAKTKLEKELSNENINAENEIEKDSNIESDFIPEPIEEKKISGPSYEELAFLVQQLATEVQTLKQGQNQVPTNTVNANCGNSANNNELTNILAALTNRKSEREVSIIHNVELVGGTTTHIELSTLTIDFSRVGETRLLSWQQFEEISSKYRSFFDRKIILVSGDHAEVADRYGLPYSASGKHFLSQKDIAGLANLSIPELESFIEKLDKEDKDTVFSYWLGKCYTRESGFYDRHKMDTLNRLSEGKFDNLLLVMNGEGRSVPGNK